MTREEYLKLLRDNAQFKAVLQTVSDDKDRRTIKAYTEDMMMRLYEVYAQLQKASQEDPEGFNKSVMKAQEDLIKNGSSGNQ
jgi:catalase (peroxidase I)